jgi:hypothetical protein
MRLWVRTGVWLNLSHGSSRTVGTEPDVPQYRTLDQTVDPLS